MGANLRAESADEAEKYDIDYTPDDNAGKFEFLIRATLAHMFGARVTHRFIRTFSSQIPHNSATMRLGGCS